MIIHNKAKCFLCGDIIESKYRHDFVTCSCGKLSVDGGKDYLKRCGDLSEGSYEDLSEANDDPEPPQPKINLFHLAALLAFEDVKNAKI